MSWKSKYYEVFGLTESATKSEVKRQYRKLAMKFHPDRNPDPKAHKLFLDLTEAYHILMDDSAVRPTRNIRDTNSTKTAAEQREERYRQGQERQRQFDRNRKLASERAFHNFTKGKRWKIFKISCIISFIVGIVLIIDFALPSRTENHIIISVDEHSYNGIQHDQIRKIETDKNLSIYLADFLKTPEIRKWPVINVERSFIFRNPIKVIHTYQDETNIYPVDFSVINLFPFLSILFFVPGYTYRYKTNSPSFYLSYSISQYLIFVAVAYILLTQLRWLHILTLGFL